MGLTENTYQSDLRRAMPHDVIMVLRQNCSARYTQSKSGPARLPSVDKNCERGLTPDQLSRAIINLTSADLKNSLRKAYGDYENKQRDFEDVLEKVRELKEFLSQYDTPV